MIKNISLHILMFTCIVTNMYAMKFSSRDKEQELPELFYLEKKELSKDLTDEETRKLEHLRQYFDKHMEAFDRNHGIKKNC